MFLYQETVFGHPVDMIDIPGSEAFHYRIDFPLGAIQEEEASLNGKDLRGIYTLNEHLSFRGSRDYLGDQLVSRLSRLANGGDALTDFNSLIYRFESVADHAEDLVKLAHNVAFNDLTTIKSDCFARERELLCTEVLSHQCSPDLNFYDQGLAAILGLHPNSTVNGSIQSLQQMTLKDCIDTRGFLLAHCLPRHRIIFDSHKLSRPQILDYLSSTKLLTTPAHHMVAEQFDVCLLPGVFKSPHPEDRDMILRAIHARPDTYRGPLLAELVMEYFSYRSNLSLHSTLCKKRDLSNYLHAEFKRIGSRSFFCFLCNIPVNSQSRFYEGLQETIDNEVVGLTRLKYDSFIEEYKIRQRVSSLNQSLTANRVFDIVSSSSVIQDVEFDLSNIDKVLLEKVFDYESFSDLLSTFTNFSEDRRFAQVDSFS